MEIPIHGKMVLILQQPQVISGSAVRSFHGPITHLPLVPHICVSVNWVSIGSENGLLPGRHQAIIWTNAVILSITPQGTYFNEILFEIQIFSFKKTHLNISSAKWRPFCPGGDEIMAVSSIYHRCSALIPRHNLANWVDNFMPDKFNQ